LLDDANRPIGWNTSLLFTGAVALLGGVALLLVTRVCHLLALLWLGADPTIRRRWRITLPYTPALRE
jgi:hypothetical protein